MRPAWLPRFTYLVSLRSLFALDHVEFDEVTLFERLVTVGLDGAEVTENIRPGLSS